MEHKDTPLHPNSFSAESSQEVPVKRVARSKNNEKPLPIVLDNSTDLSWGVRVYRFLGSLVSTPLPPRKGIFIEFGRFVWVERRDHAIELYSSGFFGKGTLSRSEPTWRERHNRQCWYFVNMECKIA
ncbi:hypothetical protein BDF14DRAFT_1791218 [Spinellus fusiger]|nr:hypothetical protein BDF14DRAFT_1791218 [Spinellus fusiger]